LVLVVRVVQALHLVFLALKFFMLAVAVDLVVLMLAQQSPVDLVVRVAVEVVEIVNRVLFPVELIMLPALLVLPILVGVEAHLKVVLEPQVAQAS
jgi:hypothetical protein